MSGNLCEDLRKFREDEWCSIDNEIHVSLVTLQAVNQTLQFALRCGICEKHCEKTPEKRIDRYRCNAFRVCDFSKEWAFLHKLIYSHTFRNVRRETNNLFDLSNTVKEKIGPISRKSHTVYLCGNYVL